MALSSAAVAAVCKLCVILFMDRPDEAIKKVYDRPPC